MTQAKEVMKLIGEKWRQLDAEAKRKYEEMAIEDKARYAAECKEVRHRLLLII